MEASFHIEVALEPIRKLTYSGSSCISLLQEICAPSPASFQLQSNNDKIPWRVDGKPLGAGRVRSHHGNKRGFYIV